MLRLLADENLDANIVRGMRRRLPELDIVRVQDAGLTGAVLAAADGRVLVTHDVQTITRYARERVEAGLPMPGVVEVMAAADIGTVINDLVILLACCTAEDLDGNVRYLPL
ncbi:MAG: hypothetical protein ABMB14_35370 [Myxococcota bacterium]